jgi:hypothetical protein
MPNPDDKSKNSMDALLAALDRVEQEADAVVGDQFVPVEEDAVGAENRRSPRLLTATKSEIFFDGQWVGASSCRNVCETGMFLAWGKNLGKGTELEIRLVRGEQLIAALGARVARESMKGIGLEFCGLGPTPPRYLVVLYDEGPPGALESLFAPAIIRFSQIRSETAQHVMSGPAPGLTPIASDD